MSALEAAINGDGTASFELLGRTWTVPTKQRLSHKLAMREAVSGRWVDYDIAICEVLLGPEQFAQLVEIDPDEDQIEELSNAIAEAMGVGDSGNSSS